MLAEAFRAPRWLGGEACATTTMPAITPAYEPRPCPARSFGAALWQNAMGSVLGVAFPPLRWLGAVPRHEARVRTASAARRVRRVVLAAERAGIGAVGNDGHGRGSSAGFLPPLWPGGAGRAARGRGQLALVKGVVLNEELAGTALEEVT